MTHPHSGKIERTISPLAVSIDDALKAVPIGRTFMYELIASGKLRTVTLGRRRLIPVEALRELIESGST